MDKEQTLKLEENYTSSVINEGFKAIIENNTGFSRDTLLNLLNENDYCLKKISKHGPNSSRYRKQWLAALYFSIIKFSYHIGLTVAKTTQFVNITSTINNKTFATYLKLGTIDPKQTVKELLSLLSNLTIPFTSPEIHHILEFFQKEYIQHIRIFMWCLSHNQETNDTSVTKQVSFLSAIPPLSEAIPLEKSLDSHVKEKKKRKNSSQVR